MLDLSSNDSHGCNDFSITRNYFVPVTSANALGAVINAFPPYQGAHDFGNPTVNSNYSNHSSCSGSSVSHRPGAPQTINVAIRHPRRYGFCLCAEPPPPSRFLLFFYDRLRLSDPVRRWWLS